MSARARRSGERLPVAAPPRRHRGASVSCTPAGPALSAVGREQARLAGQLLEGRRFTTVVVSPQKRAQETCRLAGYGDQAEVWPELAEWDYGPRRE